MKGLKIDKVLFLISKVLCLLLLLSCNNSDKSTKSKLGDSEVIEKSLEEKIAHHQELLNLETEYIDMLEPISDLKLSDPDVYWFIVSWLNTAYRTPNWSGYYSAEWKEKAKKNGIDCSGFSRVMLDQIFNKKVSGGSQGIFDHYSKPIRINALELGDLVFLEHHIQRITGSFMSVFI